MNSDPHGDTLADRVSPRDLRVVAGQIRRPPRAITGIASRCPFGYPAVIETAPLLDGEPNPTLLYLTCPTVATAVSRAEAAGAVKEFRAWVAADEEGRQTLHEITESYKRRRAFLAKGQPVPLRLYTGIGGPAGPEKASCLHAYAAALLAVMSGWLPSESGETSARVGSVERIWARFLPPVEDIWCSDGACARFECLEPESMEPEQAAPGA